MSSRPATRSIRAVTFDVGGTLIECWPSVGHIYAEEAARQGHPSLCPEILNRNFKTAWREFKDFRHTPADWSALVDATFYGLLDPPPSRTFFPQLYDRFSNPDAWRIFDEVLPALDLLKRSGLKLGVISNWDNRLRPLLRRLELDQYFQSIVVSCEIGASKPAPQLFAAACAQLGSEPAETLHVGDSREMDFMGAVASGLQAVWLRRDARRSSRGRIVSLRELDKL
jgi:putative hydrolase of the HAD superfamily